MWVKLSFEDPCAESPGEHGGFEEPCTESTGNTKALMIYVLKTGKQGNFEHRGISAPEPENLSY